MNISIIEDGKKYEYNVYRFDPCTDIEPFESLESENPFPTGYGIDEIVEECGFDKGDYIWICRNVYGIVVGYCSTYWADGVVEGCSINDRLLSNLYVKPEFRNKGAAKAMLVGIKLWFETEYPNAPKIYCQPVDEKYNKWFEDRSFIVV